MEEEDSKALKRLSESQEDKAAKKQKLDEEVEELKKHLMIVLNDDDDVYTKATPLALKVPVVDYEIYTENNKPYYKIKRVDGSHQLYISFLSMLRNFDRQDLEVLWQLVKERFASTKPKNFSDDFLLTTLGAILGKPMIMDQTTVKMCNKGMGRTGYARVLIQVNAKNNLKNKILKYVAKQETYLIKYVSLVYDWMPPKCNFCKVFRHLHANFLVRPRSDEENRKISSDNGSKNARNESNDARQKKLEYRPKAKEKVDVLLKDGIDKDDDNGKSNNGDKNERR
nr:hypothetical protein [Tanacetum cinerariifolium]